MTSCDWPIPSVSMSLRICTIDKVSLSVDMTFYQRIRTSNSERHSNGQNKSKDSMLLQHDEYRGLSVANVTLWFSYHTTVLLFFIVSDAVSQ